MTAPHPPAKSWIGKVILHVEEPPRGVFDLRRYFRVLDIREEGDQISFLLRNRWKDFWTEPRFNHWKADP